VPGLLEFLRTIAAGHVIGRVVIDHVESMPKPGATTFAPLRSLGVLLGLVKESPLPW
jgi:hypothetical protein